VSDQSLAGIGTIASAGQRLGGRIIDAIIMFGVLLTLIGGIIAKSIAGDGKVETGAAFVGGLVATAIGAAYEILLVARSGQTIGKKLVGTKVVRLSDGQIPDMATSVKRWLPNAVGLIPKLGGPISLLIGIASIVLVLTDPKRQSINDKFANTVVVRA
jgi:uncharacterized RDD family membrane protein YckC